MSHTIRLNCVAFDTATLGQGVRQLTFFHYRDGPSSDETALSESALVKWLFSQPFARGLILKTLSLPTNALYDLCVTEPFIQGINRKPGDIDVLACAPDAPHKAVALECKRVRVRAGEAGNQKVNRLDNVGDSPEQVNGLCQMGFHRVYLAVIAIVHDLSDTDYNFIFRGLREATFIRVVHLLQQVPLHERVGILYVEIAQPVLAPIQNSAVVCAGVLRPAAPREQSQELTARVDRYLAARRRDA